MLGGGGHVCLKLNLKILMHVICCFDVFGFLLHHGEEAERDAKRQQGSGDKEFKEHRDRGNGNN